MKKIPKIIPQETKTEKDPEAIDKDMKISELIQKYPKTLPLFDKYGLYCFGCPASQEETIEDLARSHQLNLKNFLEELNKEI